MAPASLADLIAALPSEDGWGPPTVTETTLNGVPYAPFSKGDKLGRMADWTADSKDRERGGRQQYNRNYRGTQFSTIFIFMRGLAGRLWEGRPLSHRLAVERERGSWLGQDSEILPVADNRS
jgi:hypothetical protein